MNRIISLLFILLSFLPGPVLAGALSQTEHTTARLISHTDTVTAGTPLELAILLEHKDEWHSYWENPGEAGLATTLQWTLPDGFTAGSIDWPPPALKREGPLAVYSYTGSVLLPVTIQVPETLGEASSYRFQVKADWLACKDICIPESAELDIDLPVSSTPVLSGDAALFEAHAKNRPQKIAERGIYHVTDSHVVISLPLSALRPEPIDSAYFFPRQENVIAYSAEQQLTVDADSLTIATEKSDSVPDGELSGLLRVEGDFGTSYYDIALSKIASPPTSAPATNLPLLLFFALIGGLILNLMPCVLPVLSLKALAIVKKSGKERLHVRAQGVAYTAGILLSFALIAGLLIALQHSGEAIGWGYQMQSPAFVGFLIYLLLLVGLNLSGWFELPVLLGNTGGEAVNESSVRGSFLTGVLATAVATPCTAPFMASAVGIALTLPPLQAMLVFQALGLGLALPFLLISFFPAALALLPKPGAWMNRLKQWLAVPMYLSVVWLLWVLMMQTGGSGTAVALAGIAALILVLRRRRFALWLSIAIVVVTLPLFSYLQKNSVSAHTDGVAFSTATLADLRASGKGVFVDATAAWCITCQLNKRVIESDAVRAAFAERGITLMIADWTLRDEAISAWLKSFGYAGVPLYVYYPAKGEPKILPQLLTEDNVITAISSKGE